MSSPFARFVFTDNEVPKSFVIDACVEQYAEGTQDNIELLEPEYIIKDRILKFSNAQKILLVCIKLSEYVNDAEPVSSETVKSDPVYAVQLKQLGDFHNLKSTAFRGWDEDELLPLFQKKDEKNVSSVEFEYCSNLPNGLSIILRVVKK